MVDEDTVAATVRRCQQPRSAVDALIRCALAAGAPQALLDVDAYGWPFGNRM